MYIIVHRSISKINTFIQSLKKSVLEYLPRKAVKDFDQKSLPFLFDLYSGSL